MRYVLVILLVVLLSACDSHNYRFDYLIKNPRVLEKEYNYCMSPGNVDEVKKNYCQTVNRAVDEIRNIIQIQRQNPEQLGFNVLQAQMDLDDLKTELAKGNADAKKADELKAAISKKQDEIKTMLSVIGLSAPE